LHFKSFNLDPSILAGIEDLGYSEPTEIQSLAIPPGLQGRDVLGLAQTGTGKTAAFALPILQRLLKEKSGGVQALILAPTRELADQIHQAICSLGSHTGLRSIPIYGGVGINPQIRALRAGVPIVVACPGRLLDHINRGTVNLSAVKTLVVDEADRMFDMGFLPDLRRIMKHLPRRRQNLLFSATMPGDVRHLAHEILQSPQTVQAGILAPAETVSHTLYPVEAHLKTKLLGELLHRTDMESVIVFTRTKHRAKRVAQQLERAGHRATSLQGNLSQNQRQRAITGFRRGTFKIMVATDIAARGIDVTQISHVINYDVPDTVDAYTHRIGRTGRVSRLGDAFTLATRDDKPIVLAIEKVLGERIERDTIAGFPYDAPMPAAGNSAGRPRPKRRPTMAT
jgi:ATP-dependent RNA helicase RhlE